MAGVKEANMTKPVPDGYHTVTPYLIVGGCERALAFYKEAFAAVEHDRMQDTSGKVRHAEIDIGNSRVMLADEHPEVGALSPTTIGGSPVSIHLYVEDVDAVVARALAAGAQLTRPVADQFYGDRIGGITDPFGHRWFIATRKEDLTSDEIRRRASAQATKG
jgi:PhnB protein